MGGRIDSGVFGWRWPLTPVSESGRRSMDHLEPEEALARAWQAPGRNPGWHRLAVRVVRDCMPVLAHNLDRLVEKGRQ